MLSIVIPAYNEEQRIIPSLHEIINYFDKENFEIIVVNDGSTDKTLEKVNALNDSRIRIVSYEANKGKGFAVKTGFLAVKGDKVLLTDSDLSTPIQAYEKLVASLVARSCAIGSRGMEQSQVNNKWHRIILGKLGNKIIQLLIPGVLDTQCGFKLFWKEDIQEVADLMRINGFGYDFELLFLCLKKGMKINEIPVEWTNAEGSKVKFYHYFITLLELVKVSFNNLFGKYKSKRNA